MNQLLRKISEVEYKKYSVRLELQADFLAGVWAHYSQQKTKMMKSGDLEEAINDVNAIGDDRLQKQSGGRSGSRLMYSWYVCATYALV